MKIAAENSHIQVISHKFDGSRPKSWPAVLTRREDDLLVLEAVFPQAVAHPQLGFIPQGTVSIEYYWLHRWYNVFCFLTPSGALRNYYCNVNLPPVFDGATLSYTDLDLDLLVTPDGQYQVLDEEEFAHHARLFSYPPEIHTASFSALQKLKDMVRERRFPFTDLPLMPLS